MNTVFRSASVLAFLATALSVSAQVTQVPLFAGTLNEGFETFTTASLVDEPNSFAIMGGAASLSSTDSQIVVANEFGLGNKGEAQPTSGRYLYGQNNPSGPTTITFGSVVGQFGGYFNVSDGFGTSTNLLSFAFFDAGGAQIGTPQVVTMPTTNVSAFVGFTSVAPIKSVTLTGRYFVADGLRANPTPEPSGLAVLAVGAVAVLRRRKQA